ncbi:hypothetical protein CBR_g1115 [Chara braunii]|uniref:Uncharacterized protein n=1 Tax=Chara braunii TaxID=69332 RepID=A0A388KDB5_CHABU|nr:hypothetical protein CBR_g1115 [Chara braunii]|eukprot:GBG67996.1 hypothetical protein CBR_g1115 [Chara braunii]
MRVSLVWTPVVAYPHRQVVCPHDEACAEKGAGQAASAGPVPGLVCGWAATVKNETAACLQGAVVDRGLLEFVVERHPQALFPCPHHLGRADIFAPLHLAGVRRYPCAADLPPAAAVQQNGCVGIFAALHLAGVRRYPSAADLSPATTVQLNGCVGDHPLRAVAPALVVKGHVGSEAAGLYRNNVGDRAGSDVVVASTSSSVSQVPGASRPATVVAAGAISLVAAGRAAAATATGDVVSFAVGAPRVVVGFVSGVGPAERAVASPVGRRRSSAAATVAAAAAVVAPGVFATASSLGCVVAVQTAGLA